LEEWLERKDQRCGGGFLGGWANPPSKQREGKIRAQGNVQGEAVGEGKKNLQRRDSPSTHLKFGEKRSSRARCLEGGGKRGKIAHHAEKTIWQHRDPAGKLEERENSDRRIGHLERAIEASRATNNMTLKVIRNTIEKTNDFGGKKSFLREERGRVISNAIEKRGGEIALNNVVTESCTVTLRESMGVPPL